MEYSLNSERDILMRMAEGDGYAFQHIFDAYWGLVYNVGLRVTKSPEMARDLSQEVFLKLWVDRGVWPTVENFKGYVYKMATNLAINQLQAKVMRETNADFLAGYFSLDVCPQGMLEKKQLQAEVRAAIQGLPPQLRQVFMLHKVEGLRHEEIARMLDITPLSSKTYMVRAMVLLRKQLSNDIYKTLIISIIPPILLFF